MENKEEYSWSKYIKDYWYLLSGKRTKFVFFTILRSLSNLITFAIAFCLAKIIDFFTNYQASMPLDTFYWFVGAIAILGAFQVWLRFFSKIKMQTIAADMRKETRLLAINKIMSLNLKWHEKEETGAKIQKINQGGESVYKGLKDFSNEGISVLVDIFGALFLFLFLDIRYVAFALIYVCIYFIGEHYYNKKLNYWENELNKIKEKVSGKIHESISNILAVKSLGLGETIGKNAESYEDEYFKILFASYFGKLKGGLDEFTNTIGNFISVKSGVGRFMTILDIDTIEDESRLKEFPENWRKIEFKEVYFKYKEQYVLKDFNLTINRFDKIGVVGESGSGKSTISKLMLKLYKPEKGKILVDGIDLNEFNQMSITKNMGVVLQEPEMFNLSAIDNITISATKADKKVLDTAISLSQLKPVIEKLPEKLNTLIGEKGYQLSGGERQRIGLARAIYKDSQIYILDEATSALDSKTESLIQEEISTKLKNKTLIIIAHRLSTLKEVKRILVLEKGQIVESGSFSDLLKKKQKFYQMYKLQNRN
ncbi:ABC transporter ATP-binding protein [Candidatus Woesearchaeota archaeon]|nr:ABC transporter ATP-binding protein [Candidatus Woesearchaeota archaeon]